MQLRVRDVALRGVLAALAVIIGYLEQFIPLPVAAPGVKLGLANVVTVAVLYLMGWRAALSVSVARVLMSGLAFSGLSAMMYALAGALAALAAMAPMARCRAFSIVGVSVMGALMHNAAQYALAAAIVKTAGLMSYLPVLMISGTLTGMATGVVAHILVARLGGAIRARAGG